MALISSNDAIHVYFMRDNAKSEMYIVSLHEMKLMSYSRPKKAFHYIQF